MWNEIPNAPEMDKSCLLQKTQQMQIMLPHRCRARLAGKHRQAEMSPHHMRAVPGLQWPMLQVLHGHGAVPALPPAGVLCHIQRHVHILRARECSRIAPAAIPHTAQQMRAGARVLLHGIDRRPRVLQNCRMARGPGMIRHYKNVSRKEKRRNGRYGFGPEWFDVPA